MLSIQRSYSHIPLHLYSIYLKYSLFILIHNVILTHVKWDFMTWDLLTENWFSLPQEDENIEETEEEPGVLTSEEPEESEPVSI